MIIHMYEMQLQIVNIAGITWIHFHLATEEIWAG